MDAAEATERCELPERAMGDKYELMLPRALSRDLTRIEGDSGEGGPYMDAVEDESSRLGTCTPPLILRGDVFFTA